MTGVDCLHHVTQGPNKQLIPTVTFDGDTNRQVYAACLRDHPHWVHSRSDVRKDVIEVKTEPILAVGVHGRQPKHKDAGQDQDNIVTGQAYGADDLTFPRPIHQIHSWQCSNIMQDGGRRIYGLNGAQLFLNTFQQQQKDGRRLFGRLANTRARSISCKAFFIR